MCACEQEQDDAKRRQLMRLRVAELRLQTVDEINQVANETVRIIETATVPILGVDRNGHVIGWNGQIAKITGAHDKPHPPQGWSPHRGGDSLVGGLPGVSVEEAMGRSLLQDLVVEECVDTTKRLLLSVRGLEQRCGVLGSGLRV